MNRATFLTVLLFALSTLTAYSADNHSAHHHSSSQTQPAITAKGQVNTVKGDQLNITHEPIPAIGWPAMTMDMATSANVDAAKVPTNSPVEFTLIKGSDGIYQIDAVKPLR